METDSLFSSVDDVSVQSLPNQMDPKNDNVDTSRSNSVTIQSDFSTTKELPGRPSIKRHFDGTFVNKSIPRQENNLFGMSLPITGDNSFCNTNSTNTAKSVVSPSCEIPSLYPVAMAKSSTPEPIRLGFTLTKSQFNEVASCMGKKNSTHGNKPYKGFPTADNSRSDSGYSSKASTYTLQSSSSTASTTSSLTPWTDKILGQRHQPQQPYLTSSKDCLPYPYLVTSMTSSATSSSSPFSLNKSAASVTVPSKAKTTPSTVDLTSAPPTVDLTTEENAPTSISNMKFSTANSSSALSQNSPLTLPSSSVVHNSTEKLTLSNTPVLGGSLPTKAQRFKRTADSLQKCGLWNVAMKTGDLMKRNNALQKDLDKFRMEALNFLKSIIKDPQNRCIVKNVLHGALKSNSTSTHNKTLMDAVVTTAMKLKVESLSQSTLAPDGDVKLPISDIMLPAVDTPVIE